MDYPPYRKLDKLTPETYERATKFLKQATERGLNVTVTESYRSPERQQYLYAQGRTRPGDIVTWTLQSKHILGEAIDVTFLLPDGRISYNGDWEKLGQLGESIGFEWGGRWKTPDKPHFQLNHNFQSMSPEAQKIVDFYKKEGILEDPEGFVTDFQPWKLLYLVARANPDWSKKLDDFLK